VINTGRPVATLAREFSLQEQTLGRWVKSFKDREASGGEALSEAERTELVGLRKENADLKLLSQ
jgi:transposase